jgi:hypothetical protein
LDLLTDGSESFEITTMRYIGFTLALLAVSCSGRDYGDRPPYAASGKVMVNDQPAKGALVILYESPPVPGRPAPQGTVGDDGTFVLSTYDPGDGAPAGDYKVSITWRTSRKEGAMDRLNRAFANAETSGLVAKIEKKSNVLPPFDLKVEPASIKAIEERAQDPKAVKTHHVK